MSLEEILQKYIEAKKLLESNELLVATGLINLGESKDSKAANALLAKVTKADADLLAKTTKADANLLAEVTKSDAEVLAKTTETAANQLRISNEKSVKWMTWLTVAILTVGLIQIVIAVIPFLSK
ncbi:MAG: hypothetical protein Q7S77_00365 [Candidatus Staskawiczbacteria bacterium]|nr:hypothetical protein [Candidatus Staskawiczbacteria bacterium]